ncbi:MAG: PAS domain S-box protein [Acidobacteria bacterium]|nr:PAS domain S-box protein [Acidobacteriota bacterium]MBI3656288.1 PAS domain S-box protein [Acidobacteriota bacterium]
MELRNRLLWLIILRFLIVTVLFGAVALINISPQVKNGYIFQILGAVSALSVVYIVMWSLSQRYSTLFYTQLIGDMILISYLVYASGKEIDPHSTASFALLYLVVIVYSSIILGRKGCLLAAVLSTIFYLCTILTGFLVSGEQMDWKPLSLRFSLNLIAFASVAYLEFYLSERVKQTTLELEEHRTSLGDLQTLHENIINSIRSGLITADLSGKIITINQGACEITGFTAQIRGAHVTQVVGEWLWSKVLATNFSRERTSLRTEVWRQTAQGHDIFLGIGATPLRTKRGQQIGFIIAFQDLTETKILEEEIKLKDKMAAIGTLAAGIAHEIRNPLAAIKGSIQLLQQQLKVDEEKGRLMAIIVRESNRLNKIVEDFLSYARPKKYKMRRLHLVPLVTETVDLLRNSPEIKENHRIETVMPDNGAGELTGDPDQIKQVLWNLAQNGLKAMPNGGKLMISIDRPAGDHLKVSFSDTGIGMSEEEIPKIFQPFYSQFPKGTGLGMSIVYQIVSAHNGKIHVQSSKGNGTTITLEFPTG